MRPGRLGGRMEREKHEPTFSASDLQDVRFRSQRQRPSRQIEPTSPWLYAAVATGLLVIISMGLIEWNARRQAVALTREMMRPMTPREQASLTAAIDRDIRNLAAQSAADVAAVSREIQLERRLPVKAPRPLSAGERCIQGERLQRIEGGWRNAPNDPC